MTMILPESELAEGQMMTAEEFGELVDTKGFELEDGRVVEKPVGNKSGWIGTRLCVLIGMFLEKQPIGWVFGQETFYRCFPNQPNRVRKPDASFIRLGRLPSERVPDPFIAIAPDLAVEVISPRDTALRVERKAQQYLDAGIKLVWIVFPDTRIVHIYRLNGTTDRVGDQGRVSGEDVLLGFSFAVSELIPDV